jgi:D-alanyl-D-alanine carboxypeptidase
MRLLYLSIFTYLLITTWAVTLSEIQSNLPSKKETNAVSVIKPILSNEVSFPILSAQAVLAVDLDSGLALYEKEPDKPLFPASTTKIMTALVAMDYYPRDLVLEVGEIKVEGQKMGLVKGEKISVDDLLYGLLVFSANDAAEVLAQAYPGGREAFVTAMNSKADELQLVDTFFTNPTGLDGDSQVTTARDLIRLADYAMQNQHLAQIVGQKEKYVKSVDGKIGHKLVSTNELLGKVEGVLGVKTGWTEAARENLVTYLEREGKRIMIVVLASQDRFSETRELIDWIFKNYTWEEVQSP